MKINKKIIDIVKRNQTKYKDKKVISDEVLKKEFFTSLKNYEFNLLTKSSYETALWIESNERYLIANKNNNFIKYDSGDIVLVDLGSNTYGGEFSYIHPAIIIKQTPEKIFIVPCSSSEPRRDENGNIYPEYELGTIKDGFKKNTVVMLYEAKYLDKNRVVSKLGKTTPKFFNNIYNKLFMQIFESIYKRIEKIDKN